CPGPGPDMAQAAAEAEQDEHRRKLQEYLAATGKVKHPSTKPYLNDRINRLDPLLKPVSKQEHADRNKRGCSPGRGEGRSEGRQACLQTHTAGWPRCPTEIFKYILGSSRGTSRAAGEEWLRIGGDNWSSGWHPKASPTNERSCPPGPLSRRKRKQRSLSSSTWTKSTTC
uniref:Uncharacterized protein n=1 Tax=Anser brachyrhynchus TaxID=132585 RepID=A0A8B9BW41_9AVES